jgi:glycosyltransferase involved in cell wall biosynthesis
MSDPLVSILIPCHNAAPWIAETLRSAQAQTWPRLEIIVVDDGSTDDSAALAARGDPARVRVIRQPQAGAAAARQRALEAAQGDFLQYLDADDLLAPDKVERQVALLRTAGPGAVATARWGRFTAATAQSVFTPESNWRDFAPVDYLVETFQSGGMMHPAAWLTPRAVAAAAGPWNAGLSLDDDGEYFTRIVLAADRIVFCAEAATYYRSQLPGSLSGSRSAAAWRSAERVCELSTGALLAREDSPRTRRACALYWLRLAFAAYPDERTVAAGAARRARALDPSARRPPAGPLFEAAARVLGWRLAKRLRGLRPAGGTPP